MIDRYELMNMWLTEYHNKTTDDVIAELDPTIANSVDWFKYYPVTREQQDAWVKRAKEHLMKKHRLSRIYVDRMWGFIFLQTAPYCIDDIEEIKQKEIKNGETEETARQEE